MKNAFYLTLKTSCALRMFKFFVLIFFAYAEKRLDKKVKVKPKIYDVTHWDTNNCNAHIITQYLKK